jgi:hypothetical protein
MFRYAALMLAVAIALPQAAHAADAEPATKAPSSESGHEGYYYPKLTSHEIYKARTRVTDKADRHSRLLFISALTKDQANSGYSPRYAMFAKGDNAEKLIIVGLDDGSFSTIYRARAVMAALSSLARLTPLLKDADLEDELTFYDVVKLLGFKEINVTDGRKFAHRITLE